MKGLILYWRCWEFFVFVSSNFETNKYNIFNINDSCPFKYILQKI